MFTYLINDPTFWVALSIVLCLGFIVSKAWKPVVIALDARAAEISRRLDEAEALRVEAEQILDEYKQKSENALHEAQEVLKSAKQRAEQLREQMEDELKTAIARQEANAHMRITRLENEAIDAVKTAIIGMTLTRVQETIANDDEAKSVEASLDTIGKTLH